MKILPAVLAPWPVAIERHHNPPVAEGRHGYRAYRSCLRWEFGFTCPFCLCHEADLAAHGSEGLGVTQIEHFVPVSHDDTGTNLYLNCFYICRFCNQARGRRPNVDQGGRRLLNPCTNVWADHFAAAGDEIEALGRSNDAVYTHASYRLNDPRKIARRRHRRETIEECLALLEQGTSVLTRLLRKAAEVKEPELVDLARLIGNAIRRAWRDLEAYEVLPQDAPTVCGCGEEHCLLPRFLEEQTIRIDPPYVGESDQA